jgi:CheY-like chemotaxis protein
MGKVLVVDDDADLCETCVDLLESVGHEVQAVGSSLQAMECLIQGRMKPDVVLLDLNLPGGSGIVVLGLIRRLPRLSHTKVVIVSGYPDMANRAVDLWDADLFLAKPVPMELLKSTVGDLCSGSVG